MDLNINFNHKMNLKPFFYTNLSISERLLMYYYFDFENNPLARKKKPY